MKKSLFLLVLFSLLFISLWADVETEPNNTWDDTGVLTIIDGSHTGEITGGDFDFWKFWSVAGDNLNINCVNASTTFDTYLHLYDSTGTNELASNDDAQGTLQSEIIFTTLTTGWHYFNLRGYSNDSIGTYTVTLTGSTPNDPNMPGAPNNITPANMTLNVPINGTILSWNWGINTETYDFYFGAGSLPTTALITDQAVTPAGQSYDPGTLTLNTTYYWQIVAKNSTSIYYNTVSGSFTTELGTDVLQIGNGTLVDQALPIEPWYGFSYSQSIYLQSEINVQGRRIEKVYYQFNNGGTLANCNQWVLYIGHTNLTSFATTDSWIPISQLSEVYNGPMPAIGADGWMEFVLTTPFVYNNADNLVIAVEENEPAYCANSTEDFICSAVNEARSIYYYNDVTNPDPTAPPTATLTPSVIPNTRLFFGDLPTGPQLMFHPSSHDYGTLYTNSASAPTSFAIQNTGLGTLNVQSVVLDNTTDFALTDTNTYPVSLTTAQTMNFTVAFTPINEGPLTGTVTITDDLRQTYVINLSGIGFNQTISSFPYLETFNAESIPIGWDQGAEDDEDWTFNNWANWMTGPQNGDHTTGTGYFARSESWGQQDQRRDLLAPPVDVTALTNPFCSFWYCMYGETMGSLHFDLWDGTQWIEDIRPAISGDQGTDWHLGDVDISGHGNIVQLRFRALAGTAWTSDIALDDISFWDNGSVPVASTIVEPADAATDIAMTGTLSWTAVPGASGYYVNMGTDNPPTNVFNLQDAGNNYSIDYSGLQAGIVYYWQIVPYNAIGNAVNCPVWSFTTFNDVPNVATLVSPAIGAIHQSITPTLNWANGGNFPDGYRVYLGTDNPPTNVIDGLDAGFVTSYQVTTPLAYSTQYFWKIIPYNFVGDAINCPLWSFTTRPENMVTIGEGTDINQSLPIEPYYGYTYSQSIYYPEEFGAAGFINSISYHYNGTATLASSTQWVIYMGLTDTDTFDSTSSWIPLDQLTMVYNDTITQPTGDEWITFSLENMFFYDGMSNLVIAVEENESDYGDSDEAFYCTQVAGPRSIYFYNDQTDPDPASPPEAYATPSFIPNTRFFMIPPSVGPYVIISALAIDFNVENVNSTSAAYNVRIVNFGQSDAVINPAVAISGINADQFTLTDTNTYPVTIPQFGEVNFDVYFHPTSAGHKEAILTIIDNVTEDRETHEIPLHGYAFVADNNDVSTSAVEVSLDLENYPAIIEPETDIDWYVFWQTGPAHIEAHTENLYNSSIDLAAFLYGPFNDLGTPVDETAAIAFDDDNYDGLNPELVADVTGSGFYYLRIASFNNSPADDRIAKKHRRNLRWETNDYALWISTDNHTPPPGFDPPTDLESEVTHQGIYLTWDVPVPETRNLTGYNVFRDDVIINQAPVTSLFYLDSLDNLSVNQTYEYKISALYTGPTGESVPCDSILVTFTAVDPPVISEDFDGYADFVTAFGNWTLLDEDGENTYGFNNGIDFPSENNAMAYIVFNPASTTPPLQFANAYSGTKYAACFSADTGTNDDWLITPQIQLTANPATVRLMARSYTVQFGMEKFEIAVSTGSANPNNFTVISGDQPVEVPSAWTPYNYSLDAYAGQLVRIAIHCVSQQTFFMMVDDVMVVNNGATVDNHNTSTIPTMTSLGGNYPNPFNPETSIRFDLKENSKVTIDVYNIKGQRIATVAEGSFNAGRHSVTWKGTDSNGNSVASGVYFYKMNCGTYTKTRKMILMK
jgi:hypothetical protein